jgi:hypothetical protein
LWGDNIQSSKSNYQQFGNASITQTLINGLISYPTQSAVASATTIAPTAPIFHVTGTTTISTITAPAACTTTGYACRLTLIPDGLWAMDTSGNIATDVTAVVGNSVSLTYDPGTSKWYPQAASNTTGIYTMSAEYSNGTCTTSKTIAPANGNIQNVTLTNGDTCALTFTQPGSGTFFITLKVIQSAVSSYNGTISGCKWPGGTVPTITATTGAVDFVNVYLDGTHAYCEATQNFQ